MAAQPPRPSDLPIRVPLVHGETNGSFLARTASANGLALSRLLTALHHGRPPGRFPADLRPNVQEMLLSGQAVTRLAALTGRQEEQLRRALPALHHRPADRGLFQAGSCLRWVFGLPLTSTTEMCPYCGGRALSCRWTPSADCPERLQDGGA